MFERCKGMGSSTVMSAMCTLFNQNVDKNQRVPEWLLEIYIKAVDPVSWPEEV